MRGEPFCIGVNTMILEQKLHEENGKTILTNRIDCTEAIETAKRVSDEGGRGKNIIPLGYIPPEMWIFDPWLIEARKAQSAGDKAEFIRLVKKFFSVHPAFAVHRDHTRRVWQGGVTSD